jgi:TonB family protein
MLRLSFVFSACVHVVVLGVMSVVLAHNPDQKPPEERTFQVKLQKNITTRSTPSTGQPEHPQQVIPKQLSLPVQQTLPAPMPVQPLKRQAIVTRPTPALTPPPDLKKRPQPKEIDRKTPPPPREVMTVAKAFPTPIPKPTVVPTPIPTPIPTSVPPPTPFPTPTPKPVETIQPTQIPEPPSPTATRTPQVVRTVVTEVKHNTSPTPMADVRTNTVSASQNSASAADVSTKSSTIQQDEQRAQQQSALKHYLKGIVTKIHAVKKYPRNARRKGWEGTVVVKLHLLPTGNIERAEIAQTSRHESLDEAALQAIHKAQPFPEFPEEILVPSLIVNIPIQFSLK